MNTDDYNKELQTGNAITRFWMFQEVLQEIILLSGKVREKTLKNTAKKNSINMKKFWKKIKKKGVNKSSLIHSTKVI
jgi:hypothetical protein